LKTDIGQRDRRIFFGQNDSKCCTGNCRILGRIIDDRISEYWTKRWLNGEQKDTGRMEG
jgi:hypothetical protein